MDSECDDEYQDCRPEVHPSRRVCGDGLQGKPGLAVRLERRLFGVRVKVNRRDALNRAKTYALEHHMGWGGGYSLYERSFYYEIRPFRYWSGPFCTFFVDVTDGTVTHVHSGGQ